MTARDTPNTTILTISSGKARIHGMASPQPSIAYLVDPYPKCSVGPLPIGKSKAKVDLNCRNL